MPNCPDYLEVTRPSLPLAFWPKRTWYRLDNRFFAIAAVLAHDRQALVDPRTHFRLSASLALICAS